MHLKNMLVIDYIIADFRSRRLECAKFTQGCQNQIFCRSEKKVFKDIVRATPLGASSSAKYTVKAMIKFNKLYIKLTIMTYLIILCRLINFFLQHCRLRVL